MHAFALRRQLLGGALVMLGATAVACDDGTATEPPTVVTRILATSLGVDAQTGTVGTPLTTPITVKLTDRSVPVPGEVVTWKVQAGGGSVDATTSTTDANGEAIVHWTLGTVAGADTLIGTTGDGTTSIIAATALADAVASITPVSGNAQDIAPGATPDPIVVKATDKYGNVVPGATITWSVSNGGALDNTTTTTDDKGLAKVTLTSLAAPGTYTITASAPGLAPITITVKGE
jgi:adhesin/invasin